MWNEKLVECARAHEFGTLTIVDASGYPSSVRCTARFDGVSELIAFPSLGPEPRTWRGSACLLFHSHNEQLEDFHEMVIKGDLLEEDGQLVMRPTGFLTGTGRLDSDAMPHAKDPIHLVKFMLLGRRKAREYLAKRGRPWPPPTSAPCSPPPERSTANPGVRSKSYPLMRHE